MYRELSREEEKGIEDKIIKLLVSECCTVRQAEVILDETAMRIRNISHVQFKEDIP